MLFEPIFITVCYKYKGILTNESRLEMSFIQALTSTGKFWVCKNGFFSEKFLKLNICLDASTKQFCPSFGTALLGGRIFYVLIGSMSVS